MIRGGVWRVTDQGRVELNPFTGRPKYADNRLTTKPLRGKVQGMTYENAPATKLLATHCAACGRPLVDSISVETGIGPICRRKFGLMDAGFSEEARHQANCIVYQIAVEQSEASFVAGSEKLRALGFETLASKILARSEKFKAEQRAQGLPEPAEERDIIRFEPVIVIQEQGADLVVRTPRRDEALDAWRSIPGRRWDRELKANFIPVSSKRYLWDLLTRFYPGELGVGTKGEFTVPGTPAPF